MQDTNSKLLYLVSWLFLGFLTIPICQAFDIQNLVCPNVSPFGKILFHFFSQPTVETWQPKDGWSRKIYIGFLKYSLYDDGAGICQ
jgi:hypothetical protein